MEIMHTKKSQPPKQATYVRPARPEDHSDLIAIGDTNNGIDYILHSFPKYIHNPNMYCYVQVCCDTVVSKA